MCKLILPPPSQTPFLLLLVGGAWSGKCLACSWFHIGLQKARHKNPRSKSTSRKILKANVNWKQEPEQNIKLDFTKLAIRIMFSYCLYSDLLQKLLGWQKHRSKRISFSLGSSKGLLRGLWCFVLYISPLTHCVKGWLVWHTVDILLFRSQMFRKQSCAEKAGGFRGRALGEGSTWIYLNNKLIWGFNGLQLN